VGEQDLSMHLLRRGTRLTAEQVACVVTSLEAACPPAAQAARVAPTPPKQRLSSEALEGPVQPALDLDEAWAALLRVASAEPIEAWMTWLHPTQSALATRSRTGPARIRGAAGTGKTVVALHRAAHLARHGRRVLFTTYVRTLSPVFASLFARLAPDNASQVDFLSVHQVAARVLGSAGLSVRIDGRELDHCFARAWSATRCDGVLDGLGLPVAYWREEIAQVIKGRGIVDPAAYAGLNRVGRRTPLQAGPREAVWRLYEAYQRHLAEQGLSDWEDQLIMARDAVRAGSATWPWDCVVVDEVQDLTCVGLQLLHGLVGDGSDGLTLVGDGQQAIYPGGCTLSEAGISVAGRSTVLDLNYRNGSEILRRAVSDYGEGTFEDLDTIPERTDRAVRPARPGGEVIEVSAHDAASQQMALIARVESLLARGARHGDIAVLVASNAAAARWQAALVRAGHPAILLSAYQGRPLDAVKVGTFDRGKGLDFAHVLIPDRDHTLGGRRRGESDNAQGERAERERRRLFVAMTRARDSLWLATVIPGR
jgi:hypothetical protein